MSEWSDISQYMYTVNYTLTQFYGKWFKCFTRNEQPSDTYGSSDGPTWMDEIGCDGEELKLSHCGFGESSEKWGDVIEPCDQTGLQCTGKYYKQIF